MGAFVLLDRLAFISDGMEQPVKRFIVGRRMSDESGEMKVRVAFRRS
jgi:hypothetical protein